jgi:alkylation response protein AidB-like acyl-CoA dehydrogenase
MMGQHLFLVALESHGAELLKNSFLPKVVQRVWTGTMCLTEVHCGTDLSLLRTKAVPKADGTCRIMGEDLHSAGEHDLSENIIH